MFTTGFLLVLNILAFMAWMLNIYTQEGIYLFIAAMAALYFGNESVEVFAEWIAERSQKND